MTMNNDYTQNELESIKWMLNRSTQKLYDEQQTMPYYGDLTKLNTDRTIMDHVGIDTLKKIATDAIDLLETSIAIYEKNGDYAVGIFSSGWRQTLDSASRRLCGEISNEEALNCGKWICHENCWGVSKRALESGKVVDESCVGDISLYAIPIFAFGKVIGVLSVGYGAPPTDEQTIKKLSKRFQLSQEILLKQSQLYQKRPDYIVKMAKKKMRTSAELIGLIVESKMSAEKLNDQREELQA